MSFSVPSFVPRSHAPPGLPGVPFAIGGRPSTPALAGPPPAGGARRRDNATTPGFPVNGPIIHNVPVTLDVQDGYACGRDELAFVETPQRRAGETLERHHVRSLSALNAHLRSLAGRVAYGRVDSATGRGGFLREWRVYGMQKTDLPKYAAEGGGTVVLPFVVGKQAIMFNYWACATGGRLQPGSHLWLLAIRYSLSHDLGVMDRAAKRQRQEQKQDEMDNLPAPSNDFWQLVPYVSHDRVPPSPSLYSAPGWVGEAIYIGIAQEQYEADACPPERVRAVARSATFPSTCDQSYRTDLRRIVPRVTVFLRTGAVHR